MSSLIFVYGTLKRGASNHAQMAGLEFIGAANTVPGFSLVDLGGYPGLVEKPQLPSGVTGEVWRVDARGLARLDAFEGVAEKLYERRPIPLSAPFADAAVEAYFPVTVAPGLREIGGTWSEGPSAGR